MGHRYLLGINIPLSRRALRAREKNSSRTDANLAEIQEKRTVLQRRLENWQGLQHLHMPIVSQFRHTGNPSVLASILARSSSASAANPTPSPSPSGSAPVHGAPASDASAPSTSSSTLSASNSTADPDSVEMDSPSAGAGDLPQSASQKAESAQLWMPSSLPLPLRLSLSSGLVDKERRLRIAQADDALWLGTELHVNPHFWVSVFQIEILYTKVASIRSNPHAREIWNKRPTCAKFAPFQRHLGELHCSIKGADCVQ